MSIKSSLNQPLPTTAPNLVSLAAGIIATTIGCFGGCSEDASTRVALDSGF